MKTTHLKSIKLTSFQTIIIGFATLILIGTLLLMLPVSSSSGTATPFHEALFTSTSAACVTGLVVKDTAAGWSCFGQAVILLLIQIGGLGVITMAVTISLLSGRKISLMQRTTMQEAISAPKMGGIVRLTRFILRATFLIELAGALALMPVFTKSYGLRGIWMAVFHSISAFCNAGFDLMGTPDKPFSSLTAYYNHPALVWIIMFLIIIGGLGFLTWEDIYLNRHHFRRYCMQSKVVLVMTSLLITIPAILFFFQDFTDMAAGDRVLCSLFQAVTPRTAGFNTMDLSAMSGASQVVIIILMLIGGSPGSTAGGMKVTTIAVLIANAVSTCFQKEDAHLFQRRIDAPVIRHATTLLLMYMFLFITGALVISVLENLPPGICFFETASAVGTVGLTLGITPKLGVASQFILIILMFLGRVGGLTLIYAAISRTHKNLSRLPAGKIMVG